MRIASDQVQQGENIVMLAARLIGDPLAWGVIVELNNLKAPYLTDDLALAGPQILTAGDPVLYPSPEVPRQTVSLERLELLTYKRDWTVTRQGDLNFNEGGQLVTESGLPNLKTAIFRRLRTLVGLHPFHPLYGSLVPLHVGEVADQPRLHLMAIDGRRSLLRDPRIRDCSISVDWYDELLKFDLTVVPVPPGQAFRMSYTPQVLPR